MSFEKGSFKKEKWQADEEEGYLGWTEKQKQWFLRRDEGVCQFVDFASGRPRSCFNTKNLHIHFIVPPRFTKHLNLPEDQIISPFNGIVVCEFHHLNCIHPDIGILARKMYYYTPDSYRIMEQWHKALAQAGIPYWFTTWDELLKMIATARSRKYLKEHPNDPFPVKENQ